jgi:chromosome segregation ATPase
MADGSAKVEEVQREVAGQNAQVSETSFRVFLAAMEGATTEIGMGNALDLESQTKEFQIVELGRQVAEFISQQRHIDVIPLRSAIADLEGHLARHDRELCQLAEANGRVRAEQDSQLEGLRGAISEVEKEQRHEHKKVSGLQEAMGEVRRQTNQTEEAVERRAGLLERTPLGLAEAKDPTSRVESDLADLGAAMADGGAKVEEIRRDVPGLKAQLSDCPKVKHDLAKLARELATLKEEIRELREQKAAMADQRQRHEQEIRDVKHELELLRKASDSQRESQEPEAKAVADMKKVVGQLTGDLANSDQKTVASI